MAKPNETVYTEFVTNGDVGGSHQPKDADALPVVTLLRNNSQDSTAATVTKVAGQTGIYSVQVAVPGAWLETDTMYLRAKAVVDTVPATSIVWRDDTVEPDNATITSIGDGLGGVTNAVGDLIAEVGQLPTATEIAGQVDLSFLDGADGVNAIQAIVDGVGNTNLTQSVLVEAVRVLIERADGPLQLAQAAASSAAQDSENAKVASESISDRLDGMTDAATGLVFNAPVLANAPAGGGGGGGGALQHRTMKPSASALRLQLSARHDGKHKATRPARLRPQSLSPAGAVVMVDISPAFAPLTIASVGEPGVSGDSGLSGESLGPRDEGPAQYAMIRLLGTIDANEQVTVTMPVTMETGEIFPVSFDVVAFSD